MKMNTVRYIFAVLFLSVTLLPSFSFNLLAIDDTASIHSLLQKLPPDITLLAVIDHPGQSFRRILDYRILQHFPDLASLTASLYTDITGQKWRGFHTKGGALAFLQLSPEESSSTGKSGIFSFRKPDWLLVLDIIDLRAFYDFLMALEKHRELIDKPYENYGEKGIRLISQKDGTPLVYYTLSNQTLLASGSMNGIKKLIDVSSGKIQSFTCSNMMTKIESKFRTGGNFFLLITPSSVRALLTGSLNNISFLKQLKEEFGHITGNQEAFMDLLTSFDYLVWRIDVMEKLFQSAIFISVTESQRQKIDQLFSFRAGDTGSASVLRASSFAPADLDFFFYTELNAPVLRNLTPLFSSLTGADGAGTLRNLLRTPGNLPSEEDFLSIAGPALSLGGTGLSFNAIPELFINIQIKNEEKTRTFTEKLSGFLSARGILFQSRKKDNIQYFSWNLPLFPSISPSFALMDGHLIISSSEKLLLSILETKAGRIPSLEQKETYRYLVGDSPENSCMLLFADARKLLELFYEFYFRRFKVRPAATCMENMRILEGAITLHESEHGEPLRELDMKKLVAKKSLFSPLSCPGGGKYFISDGPAGSKIVKCSTHGTVEQASALAGGNSGVPGTRAGHISITRFTSPSGFHLLLRLLMN